MNSISKSVTFFFLLLSSLLFSSDEKYDFVGTHFIASYYGCDVDALDDVTRLEESLIKAIEASGASLLNMSAHKFDPHGVTLVALLSESHASIHTYPEHGSCFVDLFTCGTSCSAEKFHEILKKELLAKGCEIKLLARD